MSRSIRFGLLGAITFVSAIAAAQPEAAAPAAAPAAAKPAAPADNPYGGEPAAAAPRPKKKVGGLLAPAQPVPAQPAAAPQPAAAKNPPAQPVRAQPAQPQTKPVPPPPPPAQAQPPVPPPPVPPPPPPPPPAPAPEPAHEHAAAADHGQSHDAPGHDAPGHEASSHQAAEGHGASHHEESHEPPYIEDVNWFYGLLGESDEAEPSLLYRPKGMPTPFLATLINWGLLVWLIYWAARKQLPAALAKRKATIVQGMQEAQKQREESAERLRGYEDKLAKIDSEIERIKLEMQRAGEQERQRILAEAVERRTRMERDARRLIDTEIEAIKESLRREVVQTALTAAKQSIESQVAVTDQQRLFDEAITSLKKLPPRSLGGQA